VRTAARVALAIVVLLIATIVLPRPAVRHVVPNAVAALQEIGIYPGDHQARQVDGTMVERASLVLAMGPRHVAELRRLFGELPGNVHTLPGYAVGAPAEEEIHDPYGRTMIAYRASVRQLLGYVQPLLERLAREGNVP
jgi:protein-tyrosine-phosphatase